LRLSLSLKGALTLFSFGGYMDRPHAIDMLAFWILKELSALKYFYDVNIDGAILAHKNHYHVNELLDLTPEDIVAAKTKIKEALPLLGFVTPDIKDVITYEKRPTRCAKCGKIAGCERGMLFECRCDVAKSIHSKEGIKNG
jgi:hypothetical protein